jgi:type II secretory pathway pseudopilin PulG
MPTARETRRCRPSEQGYLLAVLTLMVALLVMSLAVAVPIVRKEIQRDQEVETMHRGQQYVRALQLYYRQFHSYPTNIDVLEDSNQLRFLRRRYADPLTGKDDWQPIYFGQNKAPTALGFFGVPFGLDGLPVAGAGSGGVPAASLSLGATPANSGSAGSDNSSTSSSGSGSTEQPLGGGPIIGFSPISTKQSILIYKTMNHYNEWEFVYDPYADWGMRGQLISQPNPGPPPNAGSPGFNPGAAGVNPPGGAPPATQPPQ